jgi:hypothetical protein
MRSICCVSVPRSSFMLCAVSMLSRAVSRHRARCRQTAQQFDVEPHCCVSVPCPSSGHLVARFGRARTRNYARCHHAGRTFHVSKCCVSVPRVRGFWSYAISIVGRTIALHPYHCATRRGGNATRAPCCVGGLCPCLLSHATPAHGHSVTRRCVRCRHAGWRLDVELVLGDCALPPGSSHTSLICGRPVLCHGNALGAIRRIGNLTRSLCYAGGADSAVALRHGRRADGPCCGRS